MELSPEWGKVMTNYSPRLFKFVLNASINTLPSPDNLRRWGVKNKEFKCGLCSQSWVTSAHILAGCPYVLKTENQNPGTDRYTWRHNSVLSVIRKHLKKKIQEMNARKKRVEESLIVSGLKFCWVKKGELTKKKKVATQPVKILELANDWKIDFDLDSGERKRPYQFDMQVCITSFKPDGFIVSHEGKICVPLELTCPLEENIERRHKEKMPSIWKRLRRILIALSVEGFWKWGHEATFRRR